MPEFPSFIFYCDKLLGFWKDFATLMNWTYKLHTVGALMVIILVL